MPVPTCCGLPTGWRGTAAAFGGQSIWGRPIGSGARRRVRPPVRRRTAALLEEAERLAAVMAKLSPLQQRVLLLRYYGDLGFAEIAEIIGCPRIRR